MKLTTKFVENAKPEKGRLEVRDTLLAGFGLRIAATGRKSWFVVGRVRGRQRRITLGTYPALSLADARKAASAIMREIQSGTYEVEPAPEKMTLEAAAREFVFKHAKPRNRGWRNTEIILRKFTKLDRMPLAKIRRQDVVRVLDDIVAAGAPIRANRALAAIKKLFAWALDRGMVDVHPIAGLRPPSKENSRERVLTDAELTALWHAAPKDVFGASLKVLLLTAQRRGEVTNMRWADIDFDRAVWTIPASAAKNGKAHEVPLTPAVVEILKALPRHEGSGLVFTTTGKTPISGFGKVKYRLDAAMGISDWRYHDLRRTAASGMARLGIPPHVIEKVLNHTTGQISGVALVYNRHAYQAEKKHALEVWAQHVASLT